ncbi:MAG: glycerophosphodiester phosphodiesterase [Thermomicrobiales bacterium]
MTRLHPALPQQRPLVIAHRFGNDLDLSQRAFDAGADMIETDIWRYRNRLELRHIKTMGPIPLLWDRWELHPGWGHRFQLEDLLRGLPAAARLFLDLKGEDTHLPIQLVETIRAIQPARQIIVCGRNWAQLDPIVDDSDVSVFYSVGSDQELANICSQLDKMRHPAISINKRYLTEDLVRRLKDRNVTIVTWTVNTFAEARKLHDLGVDGFTTDSPALLKWIPIERDVALDRPDIQPTEGTEPR